MTTIKTKYRFDRPQNSVLGVRNRNRPSTDALGAVHRWSVAQPGRSYTVEVDEDTHIIAELIHDADDVDTGVQLENLCRKHGVQRQVV